MAFKSNQSRKAAFANMNSRYRKQNRLKDSITTNAPLQPKATAKSNNPYVETPMARIIPKDYDYYILAGKIMIPFLSTSIIGMPISTHVANSASKSIKDSYKFYKRTNDIDDALFIGMKSFVNNYAKEIAIESLYQKDENDIFDDVLEGMVLLSSIVTDNLF